MKISNSNTFHSVKPSNTDCPVPVQTRNYLALSRRPAFHGNTTATYFSENDPVFSAFPKD